MFIVTVLSILESKLLPLKGKYSFLLSNITYTFLFNVVYPFIVLNILLFTSLLSFFHSILNTILNVFLSLNFYLVFFALVVLFIKFIFLSPLKNIQEVRLLKNYNLFLVHYLHYVYKFSNLKLNTEYLLNYLSTYMNYLWKNSFISGYSLVLFTYNLKNIYWYPIFKRHSIFGYYRIARQNWVELKSEEVNYIKY